MSMFDQDEMSVERGCGMRVKGGVYAETMLGPNGHPIECFIKDPPIPIDVTALGLSHVGVKIIEQDGVHYIFDWIGSQYYPNVTDLIEEVRRFGASRRLPNTLNFELLSPNSKLVLIHDRVRYKLTDEMRLALSNPQMHHQQVCPLIVKAMHDGFTPQIDLHALQQCARHWWYDIDAPKDTSAGTEIVVKMPSFEYKGITKVEQPKYEPGIFLVLPIHRIAVVKDPGTGSHEETSERISSKLAGTIPIELVDS